MRNPRQLFSGIYTCGDCGAEWEFEHAADLRCPDCGGADLDKVEEISEEEDE